MADSDEHTEDGHLTERLDTRVAMMKKRMKKLDGLVADVLPPTRIGIDTAEIVIVGWGSTYGAIVEAVQKIQKDSLSVLHFAQVFPLPANITDFFTDAKKIIVVENNFSGQFADLLEKHGVGVTGRILKYDGEPFGVDELQEKISALLF